MTNVVDMRDAFFNQLYDYVAADKNIFIITADHGAFGLKKIEEDFPNQFLNVGIAEQAMIGIASGLAKSGKKVYVYAINNFVSLRVLEQVNIDLCAMNLDVNIIGVGSGFTYSTDGPTHHGTQDLAAMINLPNLEVYNVTDDLNTKKLVDLSYNKSCPKYFRIEKGKVPRIYSESDEINFGYKEISKGDSAVVLLSTGFMTQVSKSALDKSFINTISHLDVFRVSPLPYEKILQFTKGKNVIVVEENNKSGGFGEKVFCFLKEKNHVGKVLHICLKDDFYFKFGTREMLHKSSGLDEESILKKIDDFIN